jgi:hypothetical protein
MSQVNPFTGSIVQTAQVQRAQSADREHQVRKQEVRTKDAAAASDLFEHTVESSDAVSAIHEQDHSSDQGSRRKRHAPAEPSQPDSDQPPTLDLTA